MDHGEVIKLKKSEDWAEALKYHQRGVPESIAVGNRFRAMIIDHRRHGITHKECRDALKNLCPGCADALAEQNI